MTQKESPEEFGKDKPKNELPLDDPPPGFTYVKNKGEGSVRTVSIEIIFPEDRNGEDDPPPTEWPTDANPIRPSQN